MRTLKEILLVFAIAVGVTLVCAAFITPSQPHLSFLP